MGDPLTETVQSLRYLEIDLTNVYCFIDCCRFPGVDAQLIYYLEPNKVVVLGIGDQDEEYTFIKNTGSNGYLGDDPEEESLRNDFTDFELVFGEKGDQWSHWKRTSPAMGSHDMESLTSSGSERD